MEEQLPPESLTPSPIHLSLPDGIIGFPQFNNVELIALPEELPFLHLRDSIPEGLQFIVLQPYGFFPNYNVEISHEDLLALNIKTTDDTSLLNIINLNPLNNSATINLIAPILYNKHTLVGRQVIIKNFQSYSATHPLLSQDDSPSS